MTYHRSRSRNLPPSPSMAKLHFKLAGIVSRQDQLKVSFSHLKSQIKIGLLEAEDVFSSLAVPLMKLVGLKTAEMADEGRSNTFFMNGKCEDIIRPDTHMLSSTAQREYEIHRSEEDYTNRATMAGKELIQKQKLQLIQLVQLLKQVESCINSSQKSMFQTIDDHKDHIHKFMQKAVTYLSVIQQSSHDRSAFIITLKLLKATYSHVCAVLSSVEGGVDNLIKDLTEEMCMPIVAYVKSLKAEMTTGTCVRLLVALEDIRGAARDARLELEQAREKVRAAEERKLEALSMLKDSEERIKKMEQHLGFYPDDKKESTHYGRNNGDQTKDDKLLWELLKKKWAHQPKSPFGPKELLPVGTSSKHHKTTIRKPPMISRRPATRAYGRSISSKVHSLDPLLPLGSSPSASTKQAMSHKCVSR